MIRIDDLVRQRLGGREEQERPGAWLQMCELLDQEMPQTTGTNWRRIFGYLSLLLLLGAGSIGGYKWYQSGIGSAGGAGSSSPESFATTASELPLSTPPQHSQATASHPSSSASALPSNAKLSGMPGASSSSTNPKHSGAESTPALARNTNNFSGKPQLPKAANATGSILLKQEKPGSGIEAKTTGIAKTQAPTNLETASAVATAEKKPQHPSLHPLRTTSSGLNIPGLAPPKMARVKHDSVLRLELVSRRVFDANSKRYVEHVDTFPMGKFARTIFLPVIPEESAEASGKELPGVKRNKSVALKQEAASQRKPEGQAPQSVRTSGMARNEALASNTASVGNLEHPVVPAASATATAGKISTQSSSRHFSLFDFSRLAEAMDQVKSQLQRIEMYPGIMAGINASMFTPNALGGLQAGISSLFILNDWWSLMTELKYFQRYNTGSSVRDDYMQVLNGQVSFTQVNGVDYKEYKWTERSIRHSFNYDVIRTFEMPVMLRRSWGQAYAQGGLNLMLSSAIAASETSDSLNDFASKDELRPATHNTTAFNPDDHPLVLRSDFGSRFGVGYVLSAGYMFSPNIYVDGRITQSFWDNSKTEGSRKVAQDLLRTPSIQISVGYKFGPKPH